MAHFYLTTPIYYVNDDPHIGHAYANSSPTSRAVSAATGHDVRFLTGTDEHGQKIERAARTRAGPRSSPTRRGRFPRCGRACRSRTTTSSARPSRATKPASSVCRRMRSAGTSTGARTRGGTARAARHSIPNRRSRTGAARRRHPVERVTEKSYFFRLSRFTEPLLEHYEPSRVRPPGIRLNEVKAFVETA